MHENGERAMPSEGASGNKEKIAPSDSFLPMQKFPGAGAAETAPERRDVAAKSAKKGVSVGIVLVMVVIPTALFVAVVAGLAWFAQYLPSWRTPEETGFDVSKPVIRFLHNHEFAQWETEVYDYATYMKESKRPPEPVLEIERGWKGYYDYFFFNDSPVTGEIGVKQISCDCSTVKICVLDKHKAKAHFEKQRRRQDWTNVPKEDPSFGWQTLKESETRGVAVPPGKGGLIRLSWQARKGENEQMNLALKFWTQPLNRPLYRNPVQLAAPVFVVPPISVHPAVLDFGKLIPKNAVSRTFACWSATRDDFQVTFPKNDENPCIHCEAEKISKNVRRQLLAMVTATRKYKPQIKSGYKVTVTVIEGKDGKQLDIGSVYQHVPIRFSDADEAITAKPPVIKALVISDVRVVNARDNVINLGSFSSQERHTKRITLSAPRGIQLRHLSHKPAFLSIKLKEKKVTKGHIEWEVNATAPAQRHIGPFPEDSVLLLESIKPDGKKRKVRIPIVGTALVR